MPKPFGGATAKKAPIIAPPSDDSVEEHEIEQASAAMQAGKAPNQAPPIAQNTAKLVGEAVVSLKDKTGLQQHATEQVEAPPWITPATGQRALVEFACSKIVPTGQYQNMTPHVKLTMPCATDTQEIEDTWTFVKQWVDDKLAEVVAEIEGAQKS